MKVNKLFRVYAYKVSSKIFVIELYTSLKEAQARAAKFIADGYDVVNDFAQQKSRPIIVGAVISNPTEFELCYYYMVNSGQVDGVAIFRGKGGADELL